MKKLLVISCLIAASLIACGPKNKSTTPNNTQKTETKPEGSAAGGATYGTNQTPTKPAGGSTDDPCAAH
jgi:hypothetical protein